MNIRLGIVATLAACTGLTAQDYFIVGPRALGMGGTGVAVADDQAAQYYNPALFGYFGQKGKDGARLASDNGDLGRKDWGVGLDANGGARNHGDLLDMSQELSDLNIDSLGQNGVVTTQDVNNIVTMAGHFPDLDDRSNVVTTDGSVGLAVRIGHFAIGARMFAEASARVSNVDLVNVDLPVNGSALATSINATGAPDDGTVTVFSTAQRDQLYASFGGAGPFDIFSAEGRAVAQLDFSARQQGLSQGEVDNVVTVVDSMAQAGGGTLDTNTTSVLLSGFALGEVPISYGHALSEHLSFGVTIKAMFGRVYGTEVSVFDDDAATNFEDATREYKQSTNVGIDLGVAYRMPWLQVGLVGRNLNAPSFDGFTTSSGVHVPSVTVDPQVTVGVALIPRSWFTLSLDADVLKADTTFHDYQTQRVGAGVEFTPGHIVALRAGAFTNVAEDDIGPVVTAGLGLNLWAVRIDLGAAMSLETTEVDGSKVPSELRGSFGLMCDF